MIIATVFLSILNQMEFHLVQNLKKNCHHDHIPFNVKGNGNIVFSIQGYLLMYYAYVLYLLLICPIKIYRIKFILQIKFYIFIFLFILWGPNWWGQQLMWAQLKSTLWNASNIAAVPRGLRGPSIRPQIMLMYYAYALRVLLIPPINIYRIK